LKSHYEKAKKNVNELEFENQNLNDQLIVYAERMKTIENPYNN